MTTELAGQLFASDARGMALTVVHDDGLYRHLRFRRPDTTLYWFDLVTWPNCLCFTGDVGTWVFSRVKDMIDFFSGPVINPGYWAEKVREDGTDLVTRYDEDLARAHVTEAFREWADAHGWVLAATRDLWEEIDREVLEEAVADEQSFRSAVDHFSWAGHPDHFRFDPDAWEWQLHGFRAQYLWACFAVQWGVNRYRAHLVESADPAAVITNVTPARPPVPRVVPASVPVPEPAPARRTHGQREIVKTPRKEYL
jgi:hypothetical protein